jgi:predicted nucleic acid-binding protein
VTVVLDTWAVFRFLTDDDPTAEQVAVLLDRERPIMSWINLGEVFSVLQRLFGDDAAASAVRDMRREIDCELPDDSLILEAARIKADHRLSYADAFAAATAVAHDAELWTGDPELLVDGAPWRWLDLR